VGGFLLLDDSAPDPADWPRAALLGVAGGLRTFMPIAALAARGQLVPRRGRPVVYLAALGELGGDKLPAVPSRLGPPALGGRLTGAALAGRTVAGRRGLAAGAAGALAGAFGGYRARASLGHTTGVADALIGVAEDGVAITLAAVASKPRPPRPAIAEEDGAAPDSATDPEATPRTSLAGVVTRGLLAGAVGTAVMTGTQLALQHATGAKSSSAPGQVGRMVITGLGGRVPRRRRAALNDAMHWLYGISWGVPLALAVRRRGRAAQAPRDGALLGLAAWGVSLAELPALGLAPPVWKHPPASIAGEVGVHLSYGVGAAAALRALTR
jgi:hypothetical protein